MVSIVRSLDRNLADCFEIAAKASGWYIVCLNDYGDPGRLSSHRVLQLYPAPNASDMPHKIYRGTTYVHDL